MPHKEHLIDNPFAPKHRFVPCSKAYLATLKHAELQDKKEQLRQLVEQGLAKTGAPGSTKADLINYCTTNPRFRHKPVSEEVKAERRTNRQAFAALRRAEKTQFTPQEFADIYRPNQETGQCTPYPLDFKIQYQGKQVDFPDFTHSRTKLVRQWDPKKLAFAQRCIAPALGPGWLSDILLKSFGFKPHVFIHRNTESHFKSSTPGESTVTDDVVISSEPDVLHITDLTGGTRHTEVPLPAEDAENLVSEGRSAAVPNAISEHADEMRELFDLLN